MPGGFEDRQGTPGTPMGLGTSDPDSKSPGVTKEWERDRFGGLSGPLVSRFTGRLGSTPGSSRTEGFRESRRERWSTTLGTQKVRTGVWERSGPVPSVCPTWASFVVGRTLVRGPRRHPPGVPGPAHRRRT